MFMATDKNHNVIVSGQSKGQVFRFLVQKGLKPSDYTIKPFDDNEIL